MGTSILKEFLSNQFIPAELQRLKSFDIIGDIAIIKVPSNLVIRKKLIAEAVMSLNKRVKTVLEQTTPTSGEFRLRQMNHVCGEKKTETVHKEYDCFFKTDLAEVYFSPRLSFERMRITKIVQPEEIVINMFAGVGCFSILLAKHSKVKKIYSIDINPRAVQLMRENVILNKVEEKIEVIFDDSKRSYQKRITVYS